MDSLSNLKRFLNEESNMQCADCTSRHVKFASLTYGSILCSRCSAAHQKLGGEVRFLSADKMNENYWNHESIHKLIGFGGNKIINERLEAELPHYYRRPWPSENCPDFLYETFVRAKYVYEEFSRGAIARNAQQHFACLDKSGHLLKKLRDSELFCERFFELSVERNFFRYYVKATDAEPKETIDLEKLNMSFINSSEFGVPPHTLLIQFVQNAATRHLFLRSEESRSIVNWYNCIRMGKYHRLCINYACMGLQFSHADVALHLTRDIDVAGWLDKTGPKKKDAWRKRWCMLVQRHLLYTDKPLSAFARGEIFIGSRKDGYDVQKDTPDDWKKHTGFAFTLYTTTRPFVFVCDSKEAQLKWVTALSNIIQKPLTLDETKRAAMVAHK